MKERKEERKKKRKQGKKTIHVSVGKEKNWIKPKGMSI